MDVALAVAAAVRAGVMSTDRRARRSRGRGVGWWAASSGRSGGAFERPRSHADGTGVEAREETEAGAVRNCIAAARRRVRIAHVGDRGDDLGGHGRGRARGCEVGERGCRHRVTPSRHRVASGFATCFVQVPFVSSPCRAVAPSCRIYKRGHGCHAWCLSVSMASAVRVCASGSSCHRLGRVWTILHVLPNAIQSLSMYKWLSLS
jgi:hypothetical protein